MDDFKSLNINGLHYSWGDIPALSGIDINIASGEMVAIIGPNGAGKSTLLRMMSGYLEPARGSISLEPMGDISRIPRRTIARILALVPQYSSVFLPYTVAELTAMGRYPFTGIFGSYSNRDKVVIERAMEVTGSGDLADRPVTTLSGGEFQRAIIAKALAQEPKILLMDEPTAHLDIAAQMGILEIIKRYNREFGVTVISVLHDINLAASFFGRAIILRDSYLIADGPVNEVLNEDIIEAAYSWPVITRDIEGRKIIIPLRKEGV